MSGFLTPDEFKTREQFEAITKRSQDAYQKRFREAFHHYLDDEDTDTSIQLDFINHFHDLCEWTLSPEDYERIVGRKSWDHAWENAERLLEAVCKAFLDRDELPEAERLSLPGLIERGASLVRSKWELERFQGSDDLQT